MKHTNTPQKSIIHDNNNAGKEKYSAHLHDVLMLSKFLPNIFLKNRAFFRCRHFDYIPISKEGNEQ